MDKIRIVKTAGGFQLKLDNYNFAIFEEREEAKKCRDFIQNLSEEEGKKWNNKKQAGS